MRLAEGLTARGHALEVFTTSLTSHDARGRCARASRIVNGVPVHYLATPLHFRWMGLTPTLPLHPRARAASGRRARLRLPRPDRDGRRDVVQAARACPTSSRGWAWSRRSTARCSSSARSMRRLTAASCPARRCSSRRPTSRRASISPPGISDERIVVRPHGFPEVVRDGRRRERLRERLGLDDETPRRPQRRPDRARQGARAARAHRDAAAGRARRDRRPGRRARRRPRAARAARPARRRPTACTSSGRCRASELPDVYADADVFVLPSGYENFGMVAAEAAAAGARDRRSPTAAASPSASRAAARSSCRTARRSCATRSSRLLGDPELRRRLGDEAREVAEEWSWPRVLDAPGGHLPPSARRDA